MEYDTPDYQEEKMYDEGYSEKQSALDNEIQAGGWKSLTKFQDFVALSRRQKIFLVYQAVTNNIYRLISNQLLNSLDGAQEELLGDLKDARMVQDILLNCLLWDRNGELEEYMVPKDVWELIK